MIRTLAAASALFMLGAFSAQAQSIDVDGDVRGLVGDTIKLTGPVTVAKPDAILKVDSVYRPGALLTVPVAFARTARLDSEVHASSGQKWGWDNDVVFPAGTIMYHATFQHLATASTPLEAWCADQSYTRGVFHDKTSHGMYCIAKTKDGKAVGLYGGASGGSLAGSAYYPEQPQWFAFSLAGSSLPFDYPAMSEAALPSPPMTLSLKLEVKGGKTPDVGAVWTLSGPADHDPAFGVIWRAPVVIQDNHIRVVVGADTVSMDYDPETKSVTHVAFEAGTQSTAGPVGIPLYYWEAYQLAQQPQPASAVEDTPWQFGAEHVKPETISLATGPLAKKDVLLTAAAQLGPRYRLKSPLAAWGHNAAAPAGSEVYPASDTHRAPDGTLYRNDYWCVMAQCVPASPDQTPGGQGRLAWQLSPASLDLFEGIAVTPYRPEYLNVGYRPVDAVADPDPAPKTDTVQMRIADVQDGFVMVSVGLADGDKFTAARGFTQAFDANGDATFSLWTKRIRLHRTGKTVTAAVTDDGTGEGPQLDANRVLELAR